jgi:hypothetical protein
MARFRALSLRVGILVLCGALFLPLRADSPPATNTAPAKPAEPEAKPAAATPTPTPPKEDYFSRYGNILSPGDAAAHPFKLTMPFPDVGEVKVPSQDELKMRDKLEELATLNDDQIREQLQQWPPFSKMSLADEGSMLMRIQQFKDRRHKVAMDARTRLGLSTLTQPQNDQFEKEYWDKRLQMDRDIAKQFEPILHDHEQKFEEDLFRQFSVPAISVAVAQAAKPTPSPTPAAAPDKPPMPAPAADKDKDKDKAAAEPMHN